MSNRRALICLADSALATAIADRLTSDGISATCESSVTSGSSLGETLDIVITDIVSPEVRPFLGSEPAEWYAGVHQGLTDPFRLVRTAEPLLAAGTDARIILIAHGWASAADAFSSAAAATQGGGIALMKTLARDLGPTGITVNTIAVPTGAATGAATPAGAIAATVSYLVSALAGSTTGQILTLGSGGEIRP